MVVLLDGGRERVRRSASQYATPSAAASEGLVGAVGARERRAPGRHARAIAAARAYVSGRMRTSTYARTSW